MRTDRIRSLGWAPEHTADAVLANVLDALREGPGASGQLLYRGDRDGT